MKDQCPTPIQLGEAAPPPTAVPPGWSRLLGDHLNSPPMRELERFVASERAVTEVYPPADDVFRAFQLTPPEAVRVVLLGQDPYHHPGQADGLCFSVRRGVPPPPSLRNIFAELHSDLQLPLPSHGSLEAWARQGVLLLNTVLTVRARTPLSHRQRGWEAFTDCVIERLSAGQRRLVFVLWGKPAQSKRRLIDEDRHEILMAAHPSPLSAYRGFLGCRPFSGINRVLQELGEAEIDWRTGE